MDYSFDASHSGTRRNSIVGAIAILGLFALFIFAIMARRGADVPLVVVVPAGTAVVVDDDRPRLLPAQPGTSAALSSFYFVIRPGAHEVAFQERGKPRRLQTIRVAESRLPVIYTLLRDSLHQALPD